MGGLIGEVVQLFLEVGEDTLNVLPRPMVFRRPAVVLMGADIGPGEVGPGLSDAGITLKQRREVERLIDKLRTRQRLDGDVVGVFEEDDFFGRGH